MMSIKVFIDLYLFSTLNGRGFSFVKSFCLYVRPSLNSSKSKVMLAKHNFVSTLVNDSKLIFI